MDYKEQIEQAKRAAVKWREKHPVIGVGEIRVDCMVDDLTRSITDLLARAEVAEARCKLAEKCFDDSALHACETQLELEKKARTEAEERAKKAEKERDAAVSDLETIMAYNSDTCQFCKNGQCYVRGGTKSCLPKWRGQKEE